MLALLVAVLGLLIAAGSLVVAVRSSDMSEEKLAGQARRLAGVVWKQEAAALLRLVGDMGDARPAEVEFTRPDLVFWRADGGDLRGSLSQIKGYYRGLERGRLVVRGPAGWGKTVLAIQLVCDLAAAIVGIDTTAAGSTSAVRVLVPVRVSAPAFNPAVGGCDLAEMTGEELADRFDAWLGEQLVAGYGVSEKVAAALATGGWVLPVLDGVDEMDPPETPPRRAAALMVALNQPTALGARAVVLTCRTDLYHLLVAARPTYSGDRDVLQDATVVDVQPLRAEAVRDYLCYRFPDHACSERGEPRWRPVLDRLTMDRAEDPVVAVLRSPLRLFLALTAYGPGSDPNDLIRHAAAGSDLDERLFAGLIPAITTNHPRPDGRRYPATQVTRWLTTLARHLRDQERAGRSGTDLHLNELWSAAGDRAPRYATAAVLTTATATSCLLGLAVGALAHGAYGVVLAVDSLMGMVVAYRSSRRGTDLRRLDLRKLRTRTGRRHLAGRFAIGFAAGFSIGFAAGFAIGFEFASAVRFSFGLAVGLVLGLGLAFGLAVGLALGLTGGLESHPDAIDMPRRLVTEGITHATVQLAVGFMFGFVVGFAFGLTIGAGVGFGFVFGFTGGLPIGLVLASRSPWPRYLLACLLLARRGGVPRRLAVFLDWAYDAGLMRLAGTAVQFRHREFQDWLIHNDPTEAPSPPATSEQIAGWG